jgi:hypothetical protein
MVARDMGKQNPRPCLKVECEVGLHIKRNCDEKWTNHDFIKDHQHMHIIFLAIEESIYLKSNVLKLCNTLV